ncbi:MAG: alpha/beta hydrolase-fold protein [Ginsengibacter sp.]
MEKLTDTNTDAHSMDSLFLKRQVCVDFYFSPGKIDLNDVRLLLINDGQDLITMNFEKIIRQLYQEEQIYPLLCVGIHCGEDRKNEYGTANILNHKGQGAKAALYSNFIFNELIPFIKRTYNITTFSEKSFCGFSLGGLSALDIVWNHPKKFSKVGVFSGSLWWRSLSENDPAFSDEVHRIMHNEIKKGDYYPWLKFFFEAGTLDEAADRNGNGIIDSIDDTLSLIDELSQKGYDTATDIHYLQISGGRHNVGTWALAFPEFLKWGWRKRAISNEQKTMENKHRQ